MTLVSYSPSAVRPTSRSGYVWRQLLLPVPVDEKRVSSFLVALSGLSRAPFVVFEVISRYGEVVWRLGTEPWALQSVHALALAHLPGVRFADPDEQTIASGGDFSPHRYAYLASDTVATNNAEAARVHFTGSAFHPLKTSAHEAVTRSLLAVLAGVRRGETVRVQLVCGRRLRPRSAPKAPQVPAPSRDEVRSLQEPGFEAAVRISAAAHTTAKARWLVSQTAAALKGLELPPVRLQVWRTSPKALVEARSPWLLPMHLRASEIPGLLAWPLAEDLPGVASVHPIALAPSPGAVIRRGVGKRLLGRSVTSPGLSVGLSEEDSLRHLHLIGPTGVGKSTLMAHLALADIHAGHGVVVVDPKGDLVADIAARIPDEVLEEVVIISGKDSTPVGINPLVGARDPDLSAEVLLGIMHSLYADSWGPRTHDILHACLLTLARRGDASLVMVPLLLTNPGFRRSITGREAKRDPLGLGAFWAWYEALSDGERQQAIAPLLNKLRPILLRPQLRAIFGQRRPTFQFADIFAQGAMADGQRRPRVVLVDLSKGRLGEEAAQLLGSVVVSLVWQAALGRAALQAMGRRPVMVHIDEVQDYLRLPGDLSSALAQARGLGVGLTLAHQHLGQLPKPLLKAVLANARSRVAFTLTGEDAKTLANLSGGLLTAADYQQLPAFEAYAQVLAGGELQPPCSLRTTALTAPLRHAREAVTLSRRRWGQALDDIEADLITLAGHRPSTPDSPAAPIGRIRRPHQGFGQQATQDGGAP